MSDGSSELDYYAAPAPRTDASMHADLLAGLATDLGELCEILHGLLLHGMLTPLYDLEVPQARVDTESGLRTVAEMLTRLRALDPRPLSAARPPERRLLGTCRHFATLLCAILRHQGRPARARCGFASYFIPGRYEDHWVCEVFLQDEKRWVLVDAQVDPVQRKAFRSSVNPLEVSREEFIVGGAAWQQCRRGEKDPADFGLRVIEEQGLWFVCGDFVRDVAALNKVECLPWDSWGLLARFGKDPAPFAMAPDELLAKLTPAEVEKLDQLAGWTASDVDLWAVRRAYEAHDWLRAPEP